MRKMWQRLRNIIIVAGCLLGFFAFVELLRAYNVLYEFRPWAGYTYALIVLFGIIWGVFCWWRVLNRYPAMPRPPGHALAEGEQKQHIRFLVRYIAALSENPRWGDEEKRALVDEKNRLGRQRREDVSLEKVHEVYNLLDVYVQRIREDAEQEVRRSSRDVMIFVALSPWHSIDLLVVLYRNYKMVSRISGLYQSTPRVRGQLNILMDLAAVVATVNILNFGGKLSSGLLTKVPVLGKFADDIAQGVGASLFTSMMGHAAIDRLQSFRCWNETAASKRITGSLIQYVRDLTKVLREDVLYLLKKVIKGESVSDEKDEEWDTLCSDVEDVVENAAEETAADIIKRDSGFLRIGESAATMARSGKEKVGTCVKKASNTTVKAARTTASTVKAAGRATVDGVYKAGGVVGRAGKETLSTVKNIPKKVSSRFHIKGKTKNRKGAK